jgi:hypothetical protein
MFDSALIPQESHPDRDFVPQSPPAEGLLVLDPVGDVPGIQPILLDGRRQFIGTDAACAIQLPESSVRSRHAVILRGRRHNIIKAFDHRTWLNGLPVTESMLRDGDRLQAGPFDFRVREATAGELPQCTPPGTSSTGTSSTGTGSTSGDEPDENVACQLAVRRQRLSAIRTRLKERRAQLRRERASFQAERALFEVSQTRVEPPNSAISDGSEQIACVLAQAAREADAPRHDAVTNNWERDADRVQHLFHRPLPPANAAASDQAVECGPAITDQAQVVDEHTATTSSVNDYMEQLLNRRRAERAEFEQSSPSAKHAEWAPHTLPKTPPLAESPAAGEPAAVPASNESQAPESKSGSGAGTEAPVVDAAALAERGVTRERRQAAINELRAGVDSLREVANVSARTAVAKHTSRKLRRLYAGTVVLTTISFILVGVFAYLGQSDSRCYGLSFGAMMVGIILLIEFRYRSWKIRNKHSTRGSKSARHQSTPQQTEKSPSAADKASGSSPSLPSR